MPVEYVRAVLEVKSSFSIKNVKEAIGHLGDLSPVMKGLDDPHERYKLHLPPTFFCGLVFVELRRDQMSSEGALREVISGMALRKFFGGVVLRAEGHTTKQTGRIELVESKTPLKSNVKGREAALMEYGISGSKRISEHVHIGSMISWSEAAFAKFAFDLVAMLQGTYEVGRVSSFYGLGSSFHEMMAEVGSRK
jgi:hypothetical protein